MNSTSPYKQVIGSSHHCNVVGTCSLCGGAVISSDDQSEPYLRLIPTTALFLCTNCGAWANEMAFSEEPPVIPMFSRKTQASDEAKEKPEEGVDLHMRCMTGLWRFGQAVLPRNNHLDFLAWRDALASNIQAEIEKTKPTS